MFMALRFRCWANLLRELQEQMADPFASPSYARVVMRSRAYSAHAGEEGKSNAFSTIRQGNEETVCWLQDQNVLFLFRI